MFQIYFLLQIAFADYRVLNLPGDKYGDTVSPISLETDFGFIFGESNGDYSIEFWMKPTTTTAGQVITFQSRWSLTFTSNTDELIVAQTTDLTTALVTIPQISPNVWNHVAITLTYADSQIRAYKNAVSVGNAATLNSNANPDILELGNFYDGVIREIRYWKEVLDQTKITKYLNIYLIDRVIEANLYLVWRCVDPADDTQLVCATNSSGNGVVPAFSDYWVTETGNDFICSVNEYRSNGCQPCPDYCARCSDDRLNSCQETKPIYMNKGAAPGELFVNTQISVPFTAEVWFKLTAWGNGLDINFLYLEPSVKVIRSTANTNAIDFLDASDTVKYTEGTTEVIWYHLAITVTETNVSIYIDKTLRTTQTWSTSALTRVHLGQFRNSSDDVNFNGFFADFRLWDIVRTQTQIDETYYYRMWNGYSTNLIDYWPLNEATGNVINNVAKATTNSFNFLSSSWTAEDCSFGVSDCLLLCEQGFVLESNECKACYETCAICENSFTQECTKCKDTAPYKDIELGLCFTSCPSSRYIYEETKSCGGPCPTQGYYTESSNECKQCHSSCLTCTGNLNTQCASCSSGSYLFVYQNGNNTCEATANCTGTVYLLGSTCYECDTSCATCNGPSNDDCLTCAAVAEFRQKTTNFCLSSCPSNEFISVENNIKYCVTSCTSVQYADGSNTCTLCDSSCASCNGAGTNACTSCNSPLLLHLSQCISSCPQNFYSTGSACAACDSSWLTCTGAADDQCLSCNNYLIGTRCYDSCPQFNYNNVCVNSCPAKTYADAGNNCQDCDTSWEACSGSSNSQCEACTSDKVLHLNQCLDECPQRFYELTNNTCADCDSSCLTCSGAASTQCLSCDSTFLNGNTCVSSCPNFSNGQVCVSSCPSSTFALSTVCTACHPDCLNCNERFASSCTECASPKVLDVSTCKDECPSSKYANNSRVCIDCDSSCLECNGSSASNCTACPSAKFLENGSCVDSCSNYTDGQICVNSCPSNKFSRTDKICRDCEASCATCNEELSINCTSCSGSNYFYQSTCIQTCPPKYFANNTDNTCTQCSSNCNSCTSASPINCTACESDFFLSQLETDAGWVTSCPAGTFQFSTYCLVCSEKCLECTLTSCTLCDEGYSISGNLCKKNCQEGALNNFTSCNPVNSLFPSGDTSMFSIDNLTMQYNVQLQKGSGSIRIFKGSFVVFTIQIADESVVVSGTQMSISISKELWEPEGVYLVEVSEGAVQDLIGGTTERITGSTWSFTAKYEINPFTIILNSNQLGVESAFSQDIQLDGSASYDPSSEFRIGDITYNWTCEDLTANYITYKATQTGTSWGDFVQFYQEKTSGALCSFWETKNYNTTLVNIDANPWSAEDVFRFTMYMSDSGGRETTGEIYYRIISNEVDSVQIANAPQTRINPDKKVQLSSTTSSSGIVTLQWQITARDGAPQPILLTGTNSQYLTLAENPSATTGSYTISLNQFDERTSSSAILDIALNQPPTCGIGGGSSDGTTLLTQFSLLINTPLDGDNDYPITQSFSWVNGTYVEYTPAQITDGVSVNEYTMTGRRTSTSFETVLPAGSLSVIGRCYDALGTSYSVSRRFEVSTVTDLTTINDVFTASGSLTETENQLAYITAIAFALNQTEFTGIQDIKQTLVSRLETVLTGANALHANQNYTSSVYIYEGVVQALVPITYGETESATARIVLDLMARIEPTWFQVKEVNQNTQTGTISSTQDLLTARSLLNVSQMMLATVENLIQNTYVTQWISEINEYIDKAQNILGFNAQPSEQPRRAVGDTISTFSSKASVSDLSNYTYEMNNVTSVSVPNLSLGDIEAELKLKSYKKNPFIDSSFNSLQDVISVDLVQGATDVNLGEITEPFIMAFAVSRNDLDLSDDSNSWPQCTYWNYENASWATDGCSLYNIQEFYQFNLNDTLTDITLQCACFHLTDFSVGFPSGIAFTSTGWDINADDDDYFSIRYWETTIPLIILLIYLGLYAIFLISAKCWDRSNPKYSKPLLESDMMFGYFDPNKVDRIITQLENEYTRRSIMTIRRDKEAQNNFLADVVNSGLVNKLMNKKTPIINGQDEKGHNISFDDAYNLNNISDENPIETPNLTPQKLRKVIAKNGNMQSTLSQNLENYLDDSDPLLIRSSQDLPTSTTLPPSYVWQSVESLRGQMEVLNEDKDIDAELTRYIDKFDSTAYLNEEDKRKYKLNSRYLLAASLEHLGCYPETFSAISFSKSKPAIDTKQLTGGEYSKALIEQVKEFYYLVKVSFCELVLFITRKEHKLISIFYNIHLEYAKTEMVHFLFLNLILTLMLSVLYITYIDVTDESYSQGNCIWGCRGENQMFAGVMCAILPWPIVYIVKVLFSRKMVHERMPVEWKNWYSTYKMFQDLIGIIILYGMIILLTMGIIVVIVTNPWDVGEAQRFVYVLVTSWVWTLVIGEVVSVIFKAAFLWLAVSSDGSQKQSKGKLAGVSTMLLTCLPCLLPTEF